MHYTDDLDHKNRLLDHILQASDVVSVIVFTSTKQHAGELVEQLHDAGHAVAALHGDMHQRQRSRTIDQLRKGFIRILVATDVAARGIDIPTISHVINFDLPRNIEDYVHRIGRTGRAGAKGVALSFAGHRESSLVQRIEKFTGQDIECVEIPGLEPKMRSSKKPAGSKRPFKQGHSSRRPESRGPRRYEERPRHSQQERRPKQEGSFFSQTESKRQDRPARPQQGKRPDGGAKKFSRVFNTTFSTPAPRKKREPVA